MSRKPVFQFATIEQNNNEDMNSNLVNSVQFVFSFWIFCLLISSCSDESETSAVTDLQTLTPIQDLEISADRDEVLVGRFTGLEVDENGMIYSVDDQLQQIHLFSPEGEYLESLGREGRGPGEFTRIDPGIRIQSNTLYVKDRGVQRIHLFDLDSRELAGEFNIPDETIGDTPMGTLRDMFPMDDGTMLVSFINPYFQAPQEDEEPKMITISRLNRTGEFMEQNLVQIPSLFPSEQRLALLSSGTINVMTGLTFYPNTRMAVDPGSNLYMGNSDSLIIRRYDKNGNVTGALEAAPPLTSLTNTHLDSIAAGRDSPAYRSLLDDVFDEAGRPEFWPVFDYFLFDDSGRCWIKLIDPGDEQQTWWIFEVDGEPAWEFKLPTAINLYKIVNGKAYGIIQPEDDVSSIVRYLIDIE